MYSPGPSFIKLLKQKILLNNFLLRRNELETSDYWYMLSGILAGKLFSGRHNFVMLSFVFIELFTSKQIWVITVAGKLE